MISEKYGVMVLKYEFLLSAILFLGGGAMIWHDPSLITPIFTIWGVLITFWFNRRQAETSSSNLLNAVQAPPTMQPNVTPVIPYDGFDRRNQIIKIPEPQTGVNPHES